MFTDTHFISCYETGNTEVTFTLSVNKANEPNQVTTQSVTITTVFSDLVAVIDGGSERTVGLDSGDQTLDGSGSYDPDNEDEVMTYLWSCSVVSKERHCY